MECSWKSKLAVAIIGIEAENDYENGKHKIVNIFCHFYVCNSPISAFQDFLLNT